MKVYIAAASAEIDRAEYWFKRLAEVDIKCTSSWIQNIREVGEANPKSATFEDRKRWAQDNLNAIQESYVIWMLAPKEGVMSHGAFFELGYALGLAETSTQRIVVSGGDHRWVFLALADELLLTDAAAFEWIINYRR